MTYGGVIERLFAAFLTAAARSLIHTQREGRHAVAVSLVTMLGSVEELARLARLVSSGLEQLPQHEALSEVDHVDAEVAQQTHTLIAAFRRYREAIELLDPALAAGIQALIKGKYALLLLASQAVEDTGPDHNVQGTHLLLSYPTLQLELLDFGEIFGRIPSERVRILEEIDWPWGLLKGSVKPLIRDMYVGTIPQTYVQSQAEAAIALLNSQGDHLDRAADLLRTFIRQNLTVSDVAGAL